MPFEPADLRAHQLPPGTGDAPMDREVYDRRALLDAVPDDEREAYATQADAWVEAPLGDGRRGFVFGTEQSLYIVRPGHVWSREYD
jgi:hypothetical protein